MAEPNEQVLVKLRTGVVGPYPVAKLRQLKGFTLQTLVSHPGTEKWAPAFRVLNLKSYFEGRFDITDGIPIERGFPEAPVFRFGSPASSSAVQDFIVPVKQHRRSAVDRWLLRFAVLNFLLAVWGYAAWSYLPLRVAAQREWHATLASVPLPPMIEKLCGIERTPLVNPQVRIAMRAIVAPNRPALMRRSPIKVAFAPMRARLQPAPARLSSAVSAKRPHRSSTVKI